MIKQAAILFNGIIFKGKSHKDIRMDNRNVQGLHKGEEGFVTSLGTFVDRETAAKVAYMCGQIKEPKDKLKSEDLNQ